MRITIKLTDTHTAALQALTHPIDFTSELTRIIDRGMLTKPKNPRATDFSTVYQRYRDNDIEELLTQLNAPDPYQEAQTTMTTPIALYLYATLDADTNLHIIFNALTAEKAITEFLELKANHGLADYEQFTYDPSSDTVEFIDHIRDGDTLPNLQANVLCPITKICWLQTLLRNQDGSVVIKNDEVIPLP
jgi:hypothetical protein